MPLHAPLKTLEKLLTHGESEVVEFKRAAKDYPTSDIGKYFSALANEANLRDQERAWLIFGIDDKTQTVVGSKYRMQSERLQRLKVEVTDGTEPSITFLDIHEIRHANGRVVLLEIPAAPRGMPIAWNGHYYGRAGESLKNLGIDKLDRIRQQTATTDWSAQVINEAKLSHLDKTALEKARTSYAVKYKNRFSRDEVMKWSQKTFLSRTRLLIDGKITNAAILLLGKPEAAHLLFPYSAQMAWKLHEKLHESERGYEHFGLPFLLNTSELYRRIRNVQIRILPDDNLLAVEMAKYDQKVVLEALHNCIAHQDYSRNGRIIVTEYPDKLVFENEGSFFEGQPDDYIAGDKTPLRYRNPLLSQAMTEINMIDSIGYGIHEMYLNQARRYFPMPDYDISASKVSITVYGKAVDAAYTRLLMQKTDLPLIDILALDKVQKRLPIDDKTVKRLRQMKLLEGRKPNLHISAAVAKVTNKAEYIRIRGQNDTFYKKMITDYLKEFEQASREDIDELLMKTLSDALDHGQKRNKVNNLIASLRRAKCIYNDGSRKLPKWRLTEASKRRINAE